MYQPYEIFLIPKFSRSTVLAFSGQARANRCKFCFSLSHTSKDCELASVTCDNQPSPSSQYLYRRQGYSHQQHYCRLICYQWNEQRSQTCSYPNCRFDHVCYISVHRILKPAISVTKPYSVLTVIVTANYFPISPKPPLHH